MNNDYRVICYKFVKDQHNNYGTDWACDHPDAKLGDNLMVKWGQNGKRKQVEVVKFGSEAEITGAYRKLSDFIPSYFHSSSL